MHVHNIKSTVRRLFPCESMSEAIYTRIKTAISRGEMPEFEEIVCNCESTEHKKSCDMDAACIKFRLEESGVLDECRHMIASGCV